MERSCLHVTYFSLKEYEKYGGRACKKHIFEMYQRDLCVGFGGLSVDEWAGSK